MVMVWVTFMLLMKLATLQSSAIWKMKMKQLHCGPLSGKVSNIATPSSFNVYVCFSLLLSF